MKGISQQFTLKFTFKKKLLLYLDCLHKIEHAASNTNNINSHVNSANPSTKKEFPIK